MMGPGPMGMGPAMGPGMGPGMMGPMQVTVNPATNDAPLEFNTNKNKPPMPVSASKSLKMICFRKIFALRVSVMCMLTRH